MTDNERDHLRTELEHDKALITQTRKLIARNQASIADAEKHFADSFDRLAESQKLARGQLARDTPVIRPPPGGLDPMRYRPYVHQGRPVEV